MRTKCKADAEQADRRKAAKFLLLCDHGIVLR